jgi:hypothetical protein
MAVGRREVRPNREKRVRGRSTRTGMLALLALGTGAGCGQSLLRPQPGTGLVSQTLGLVAEPMPNRLLAWDDPGERVRISAEAPGRPASVALAGNILGSSVSPDRLNGSPMSPRFDRPTNLAGTPGAATSLTWNGWKLPDPRGPEASAAAAAIASAGLPALVPVPARSGITRLSTNIPGTTIPMPQRVVAGTAVDDRLLAASRDAKIAPPMRRVAPTGSESGSGLESLIAACRETKIAPPVVRPRPTVAAPAPAPPREVARIQPPPQPAVVEAAPVILPAQPAVVEAAPVTIPAPTPKADVIPPAVIAAAAAPAPVTTPEPETSPIPMPTPIPTTPQPVEEAVVEAQVAPAQKSSPSAEPTAGPVGSAPPAPGDEPTKPVDLPDLLSNGAADRGTTPSVVPAPAETPVAAAPPDGATDPALLAASRDNGIELPQPADPAPTAPPDEPSEPSLLAASRESGIELPQRSDPAPTAPPEGTTDSTLAAASRESGIELPQRQDAAPITPPEGTIAPGLVAASRESGIELPQRPDEPALPTTLSVPATTDPLKAAAEESQIPLPVPVAVQQADALIEASKDAKIPPPATIRP